VLELVSEVKVLHPATAVIAMTASSSVNAAVEAMRRGAADYLTKPFAVDELSAVLERASSTVTVDTESRQLRERLRLSQGLGSMIGRSAEMEKLYRILSKVAQSTHPVLVLGESGTGKELVARTIHAYGPNAYKPFLAGRLRLSGSDADRERAIRLREGRLHRGDQVEGRTVCDGRGRHRLSG
jgi:DNA-binding NtrC family response regulator